MKLAPVLSQFLYAHKKLVLVGMGTFLIDADQNAEECTRQNNSISFLNNPSLKDDDSLISFISSETGKMKALAASDLHTFLELSMQFLNIGKPFKLEGIGTLVKNKNGRLDFTPGTAGNEKNKEHQNKELTATSYTEESFTGYTNLYSKSAKKVFWKKPVLICLLIVSVGLAIWAGNIVYKKSKTAASHETEKTK